MGIYSAESGNIFALISSKDILYFKVDAALRREYEAAEMPQFMHMPYFKVPESVLSDDDELRVWLAKSTAVAARAKKKKSPKKKRQS
ncbi:MAG TPA: TfoX family protein [Anaerolineae bacterium]|nr:TfoX family protein [Anaerolineae bacterium]